MVSPRSNHANNQSYWLGTQQGTAGFTESVEFWKSLLGAVTPILTAIGTIITGYFTYRAAIAKK
jgi:hypothetical protein